MSALTAVLPGPVASSWRHVIWAGQLGGEHGFERTGFPGLQRVLGRRGIPFRAALPRDARKIRLHGIACRADLGDE